MPEHWHALYQPLCLTLCLYAHTDRHWGPISYPRPLTRWHGISWCTTCSIIKKFFSQCCMYNLFSDTTSQLCLLLLLLLLKILFLYKYLRFSYSVLIIACTALCLQNPVLIFNSFLFIWISTTNFSVYFTYFMCQFQNYFVLFKKFFFFHFSMKSKFPPI